MESEAHEGEIASPPLPKFDTRIESFNPRELHLVKLNARGLKDSIRSGLSEGIRSE